MSDYRGLQKLCWGATSNQSMAILSGTFCSLCSSTEDVWCLRLVVVEEGFPIHHLLAHHLTWTTRRREGEREGGSRWQASNYVSTQIHDMWSHTCTMTYFSINVTWQRSGSFWYSRCMHRMAWRNLYGAFWISAADKTAIDFNREHFMH